MMNFSICVSEWVADNDILGEELEGNFDDIDFMEDLTDEEEDAGAAMYNTFFDSIDKKKNRNKKTNEENKPQIEHVNVKPGDKEIKDEDSKEESDDEDIEEGVTKLLGGNKKETKSSFEREQEKERRIIESLEEEQMSEKPWFLKGEVQNQDRPENSTLEEHLEYDIAAKQKPVITEDTTTLVEKLILNRIRTQAFDDVERKVKPEANPFEYKKKLLLDQEKSKKSLAEIYEEEYIKKQKEEAEDEEEPKEHTDIKAMMDSLFTKLDALANYHYMPKHRKAEVKIVSNLPAVTMEESSLATATDASLLAPQEVLAPVRGELRSAGERTTTDKKRERRNKKAKQKAKAREEERKLAEKLKKAGGIEGKKLDVKTSAKVVQKAVKAGQVKMLSDNQLNKQVKYKSSQSFFKQLQDDVSSQINKKKTQGIEKKKTKKEKGETSVSKIML
ncbi:unnamed protein product [Meganyctiphanes norvegica]|uniref:Uncharacterized protein n=1 Tax=Meganyctiphanes norvegica TaxID=48144 RepID=A0AAV2R089_MEGNR